MTQPSHVDLLTTSRQLLYVAITGRDAAALAAVADRLRAELISHIDAERDELATLPPRAAAAAARGQRTTLTRLDALLAELSDCDGPLDVGAWLGRLAEVHAALRRQALLESLVLRRQRRRRRFASRRSERGGLSVEPIPEPGVYFEW